MTKSKKEFCARVNWFGQTAAPNNSYYQEYPKDHLCLIVSSCSINCMREP